MARSILLARLLVGVWLPLPAASQQKQTFKRQLRSVAQSSGSSRKSTRVGGALLHLAFGEEVALCLTSDVSDVDGGDDPGRGSPMRLEYCDKTWRRPGQNFEFDHSGRLRLHGSREHCAVLSGGEYKTGASIRLGRCDEHDDTQLWSFYHAGRIEALNAPFRLCLVAEGAHDKGRPGSGGGLKLWPCGDEAAMSFGDKWERQYLAREEGMVFAVPNADRACPSPYVEVDGKAACAKAAEALRPGAGCQDLGSPLVHWGQLVREADLPSFPKGCLHYGVCQRGCGLDFNPTGHRDVNRSYPEAGLCAAFEMLCQLPGGFLRTG